jgi:hypothetical protein
MTLLNSQRGTNGYVYMVKVYVDNYMSLVIPVSQKQLQHIAAPVMTGIHDVFPPDANDRNNPILEKKLSKKDCHFLEHIPLLDFNINRNRKNVVRSRQAKNAPYHPKRLHKNGKKRDSWNSLPQI